MPKHRLYNRMSIFPQCFRLIIEPLHFAADAGEVLA